ncbi:MAG TPA: rhodanese-like domain-containing protein [Verrucomicrobiae bacterium]|nr:rhodanese-like domain-containing protein [Verrucomicrobiae bacterium]
MNAPARPPKRRAIIRNILTQALLVTVTGAAFSFAANALSPRGLKLSRNYFLLGQQTIVITNPIVAVAAPQLIASPASTTNLTVTATPTNPDAPRLISFPSLNQRGLQAIDTAQTLRFYQDPRRTNGHLIFVDARNEEEFQGGHIPGAHELDPYDPEKHLQDVYNLCTNADVIVVYCNGHECDDSELAALLLRNVGIPNQKIFVYAGGVTDWRTNHSPLETNLPVNRSVSR